MKKLKNFLRKNYKFLMKNLKNNDDQQVKKLSKKIKKNKIVFNVQNKNHHEKFDKKIKNVF